MRLLEHESKMLLRDAGIDVPKGQIAASSAEAAEIAIEIGSPVVLKPQIPSGGRGKAKGLVFLSNPKSVVKEAARLLSKHLLGYTVKHLLVEEQLNSQQELYLSVIYDTNIKHPVLLASTFGGVEIESVADTVRRYPISLRRAWNTFQSREVASELCFTKRPLITLTSIIDKLVATFLNLDALLVEINPLMFTTDGQFVAVDAHIELDDDAFFRHKDIVKRFIANGRGKHPLTDFEQRAVEIDQADHRGVAGRVVQFDGNLGLLIGGGGGSLATFDAVLDAGLNPANYCEIGGNPSVWKVKELTKLILSQKKVDKIAVIMSVVSNTRVDLVARGVIKGILEMGYDPAEKISAFRIPGSWEEEGFLILRHYNITFYSREKSIDEVVATIARRKELT